MTETVPYTSVLGHEDLRLMPPLLLSPFPSQYLFTIGHVMCLAFDDGSPIFKQRSSMRRSTGHTSSWGSLRDCHAVS